MTIKFNKFGVLTVLILLALLIYWRQSRTAGQTSTAHTQAQTAADDGRVRLSDVLASALKAAQLGGREVQQLSAHELNVRSKGKTQEGANDPVTDADLRSHCVMWRRLSNDHPTVRIVSEEEADNAKCAGLTAMEESSTDLMPSSVDDAAVWAIDEWAPAKDVTVWIDPLDATQEFTERLFQYVTVMVCVAVRGRPTIGVIHNPFTHDTHWAWNRRSVHSASLHSHHDEPNVDSSHAATALRPNQTVIVSRSHYGSVSNLVRTALGADTALVYAGGAGYKVLQVAGGRADAYVHSTRIKKWDLCAGNAILEALGGRLSDLQGAAIDYAADANVVNESGVLATLHDHVYFVDRFGNKM